MAINTLSNTINFAQPFVNWASLTIGANNEPAVTSANIIKQTLLSPPFKWRWNRATTSFTTTAGTQDYTKTGLTSFGFIEYASIQKYASITSVTVLNDVATYSALNSFSAGDVVSISGCTTSAYNVAKATLLTATSSTFTVAITTGNATEAETAKALLSKDVNGIPGTFPLTIKDEAVGEATEMIGRPQFIFVQLDDGAGGITFRLLGIPDDYYQVTVTYQQAAQLFGPFVVSSCGSVDGSGHTTYTGIFTPAAFPTGGLATISGFVTHTVNNGTFTIVSCSSTQLVLVNAAGVAETPVLQAFAINGSWSPIPDWMAYIYNYGFLFLILDYFDDPRAARYRQLFLASLLSNAEGMSATERDVFLGNWLTLHEQAARSQGKTQQGIAASGA